MTSALELLTTKQLIRAQKKSLRSMIYNMHQGYHGAAARHQRDAEQFARELDRREELAEKKQRLELAESAQRASRKVASALRETTGMDDERRMVLKRLQQLNPQGVGTGNPNYPTDVLKGVCDLLEGRA